mmetsp:Transcript_43348/g.92813  ORF Transcript_43348/g.92813 Transcript_43348/m.92813 type:complete len:226 (+) Transcript_43348:1033-1710(+)
MHSEDAALCLASAHGSVVAIADGVAVRAIRGFHLVVRGAVALTSIGEPEKGHIRHSSAEAEAYFVRHLLLIFLRDQGGVVHDRDVADLTELVRKLVVAELVAILEEIVLHAVHLVEAILEDGGEGLDGLWRHAGSGNFLVVVVVGLCKGHRKAAGASAVLAPEVHRQRGLAACASKAVGLNGLGWSGEEGQGGNGDLSEGHCCRQRGRFFVQKSANVATSISLSV